jgi:hypothetical protein
MYVEVSMRTLAYTKVQKEKLNLPLNQSVTFKTKLQRQNRLQIPKLIRMKYKLETSEILKVTVAIQIGLSMGREIFFTKMYESGRIHVPDLTVALLSRDKQSIEGRAIEVKIEPA